MTDGRIMIVAEISANHGNDIHIVKDTILKAKAIGCDAVKIQTYRPDTITLDSDKPWFRIRTGSLWDGMTYYKLYEQAFMPWAWHKELFDFARDHDILLFSTPFDPTAVDLLEECGNPIYKIASFEITDIPLIEYAASRGKPMIISTGIAEEADIREAALACWRAGCSDLTMLKCTSEYPEDADLNTMTDMATRFGVKVGLSDHTEGDLVAIAAAAMGARVLEKHFILDRKIGGPDASFSMTPEELGRLVRSVRLVEKAKGEVRYDLDERRKTARLSARSLFVVRDVKAGEKATADNVKSIRPGHGMHPKQYREVLGMVFARDVEGGEPLTGDMLK